MIPCKTNTPELPASGVFFWDFVGLSPVNPLANVIAYHVCRNSNQKHDYVLHGIHLLPFGRSRQEKYTIYCQKSNNPTFYRMPFVKISKTEPEKHSIYTKSQFFKKILQKFAKVFSVLADIISERFKKP